MKQWRDPSSPYGQKLYFEDREFEELMDDARRKAGPNVFVRGKGVDVDLVLLRAFELEADYVDLEPGVLGRTLFGPNGPLDIQISRSLVVKAEASDVARRRLRTTLAHEAGHVACHACLFLQDTETASLFPPTPPDPELNVLCREDTVGWMVHTRSWVEYQANQCMASLLLPRPLFAAHVAECLGALSLESVEAAILNDRGREVLRWLSTIFDVNERAIHFRLQKLGFVTDGTQPSLSREG